MPELTEWGSFYVIVGSSAGALIGLQFVVLTLISERTQIRAADASSAFATPSVVHFAVVLLVSAVLSAPWREVHGVSVFTGIVGVLGIIYTLIVARRMRTQKAYRPVFEDWLFHCILPLAAYALLAISVYLGTYNTRRALFFIGTGTLLFLFVGIHNAWDSVTYAVFVHRTGDGPR
jgi:L-asparagine transporter-like permease